MININKFNNFFFSYNSLLLLLMIIFVIINFILIKNSKLILLNNIILILLYIILVKKSNKEKKIIIITLLHFAFWGPLIESLLIHKCNLMSYKHKDINYNIPLWLPSVYCLFGLTSLYTYELFKYSIN